MCNLSMDPGILKIMRHYLEKWENVDIYYILDKSIVLILNFLRVVTVLYVGKGPCS